MKIFVFGSSLTSSYWNGAATYYRGIYKNLAALGYEVTFAEPDIYDRQKNRDSGIIDYADVVVYQTPRDLDRMLAYAANARLVIKHSGVGAADDYLESAVLQLQSPETQVAFWMWTRLRLSPGLKATGMIPSASASPSTTSSLPTAAG